MSYGRASLLSKAAHAYSAEAAGGIGRRTHHQVKAALLNAADLIRILRIIMDRKE
ncbi:hypothetical protein N184_29540 [Sinorhizobium sp. GL28]|nr:hypothetical protein N184_29540 [Sinorhizobium sp. GL28]